MVRKTENVIRLNRWNLFNCIFYAFSLYVRKRSFTYFYINTLCFRKCVNNQVFYRKGDPYPYCKNACEEITMCGEVQVPEEHLAVINPINWFLIRRYICPRLSLNFYPFVVHDNFSFVFSSVLLMRFVFRHKHYRE